VFILAGCRDGHTCFVSPAANQKHATHPVVGGTVPTVPPHLAGRQECLPNLCSAVWNLLGYAALSQVTQLQSSGKAAPLGIIKMLSPAISAGATSWQLSRNMPPVG